MKIKIQFKEKMMNRRQARESAFSILFETLFLEDSWEDLVKFARELDVLSFDSYSKSLIKGAIAMRKDLDDKIAPYLRGWDISRISRVSLAILELAFYEILYVDEVKSPIAINEAVELAKKYASPEDASFINGVLGSLVRE